MKPSISLALTCAAFCISACNFVAPAAISDIRTSQRFSGTGSSGADDETVIRSAEECAGRLNWHRNSALSAFSARTTFSVTSSILGGTTSGSGGLTSLLSSDPATKTVGGVLAIAGAVIAIIGNSVSNVLADPSERVARRANAIGYFNRATQLADSLRDNNNQQERAQTQRELLRNLSICLADGDATQFPAVRLETIRTGDAGVPLPTPPIP